MWVVKLGGSLHAAANLKAWLEVVATAPGPPRVLVPGGGPFADAIRTLQPQLGFDDLAAHRMAILAMQQYGLFLHGLEPRLALAESLEDLCAAQAAIWLPWRMAGMEPGLRPSWEVTSDSIAAWLARELDASGLVLVKSAVLPDDGLDLPSLVEQGILDQACATYLAPLEAPIWLLAAGEPANLGKVLATEPASAGRVVRPAALA